MSLARRMAFAVVSGWVSRIASVTLSLIFIHVLFARLGPEEQGFWLLLGNSALFVALMDLGFSFTLTRRIALARGKSGADPMAVLSETTRREIADLVATGTRLYRMLAGGVFLASWGLGFVFLSHLKYEHIDAHTVWLAWTILCAGYAINVWAQVWQCLLNGVGLVGWSTLVDTAINIFLVATQIVFVWNGAGLLQMAIIAACGGFVSRQVSIFIARRTHPLLFSQRGTWSTPLFRSMISASFRAWVTSLGAFLVLKTDHYFISYFRGPAELPEYNAAYQTVSNLLGFAYSIAAGSAVYVSHLWQEGNLPVVHAIVKRSVRMGMIFMACGCACIAIAGEPLINLWLGRGHFVGYAILWTFCVMLTLEANHAILAAFSRATEDEAFAGVAITAGILNLLLTFLLVRRLGLFGIALGTLVAQLLTHNWYVTFRALRRLRMSIREHIMTVLLPTSAIFALAVGLGQAAVWIAKEHGGDAFKALGLIAATHWSETPTGQDALALFAATCATGTVMVISMWFRGLSSDQRIRLRNRTFARRPASVSQA